MKILTVTESHDLLKRNEAILFDVREQEEFDEVHIENATLIPLSTLPISIEEIDFTVYQGKKIIFQCLKGGRSAQAIEFLQDGLLKEYDVYNMQGGILDWIENNLPVTS